MRYPYRSGQRYYAEEGVYIEMLAGSVESGECIASEFMDFLNGCARCTQCGRITRSLPTHMCCNRAPIRSKMQFEVQSAGWFFIPQTHVAQLEQVTTKDDRRRHSFARKQRVRDAKGTYTREQILTLRKLQEDQCFYCLASLLGPGGEINYPDEPTTCHIDHFTALCDHGTNEISNIVLACPSCNVRKGWEDGVLFALDSMASANRNDRLALRRMHAARRKHSYRLVSPPERWQWGLPDIDKIG